MHLGDLALGCCPRENKSSGVRLKFTEEDEGEMGWSRPERLESGRALDCHF